MNSIASRIRKRPLLSLAVVAVLAAGVTGTALAVTSRSAGPITAVKVVSDTAQQDTNSTAWVNLTGAATTINVPSGQKALILARFSADSDCQALQADDEGCHVRILVGGVEAVPGNANGFNFDTAADGANSDVDIRESHSMDRSRGAAGGLGPGNYPVQVQWKVDVPTQTFTLGHWSLTVERAQVG